MTTRQEMLLKIQQPEYDFMRQNPHLGDKLILVGLGGSHAYGTNIEGVSDIDIRGIAVNSAKEILLGQDFEQVCSEATDTTIYSLKKIISLLASCNPNTILFRKNIMCV